MCQALREAARFPNVALVEGSADLVAACHLALCATSTATTLALAKGADVLGNLGVVAIFGAANHIIDGALPYFAGKRVRIFIDDDRAGIIGAKHWTRQLRAAGATVDGFGFRGFRQADGRPVKDLNDFVRLDYDQWENERAVVDSAFAFVPAIAKENPKPYATPEL